MPPAMRRPSSLLTCDSADAAGTGMYWKHEGANYIIHIRDVLFAVGEDDVDPLSGETRWLLSFVFAGGHNMSTTYADRTSRNCALLSFNAFCQAATSNREGSPAERGSSLPPSAAT